MPSSSSGMRAPRLRGRSSNTSAPSGSDFGSAARISSTERAVVDYTREDFTRTGERCDLLFDVAGSRSWSESRRVLKPDAMLVLVGVGGPKHGMFGPLGHIARIIVAGRLRGSQKVTFFVAKLMNAVDNLPVGEGRADGAAPAYAVRVLRLIPARPRGWRGNLIVQARVYGAKELTCSAAS
jgi:hypothetical protein